jgi:hypothetical protein
MKIKKNVRFILIGIFFISISCKQNSLKKDIDSIVFNQQNTTDEKYHIVNKAKDEAIPILISIIDTNCRVFLGYQDPLSSFMPEHHNFAGINAVYLIDLLINDTISKSNKPSTIKLHQYCIIRNKNKKFGPFSIEDIRNIKIIYVNFYEEYKTNPKLELKNLWKSKYSEIFGKNYEWI